MASRSHSRRRFLLSAGGAVTAAAAGGAAVGGLGVASARTPTSPEQDLRVLTFLLGIERISSAFYADARRAGHFQGELAEFIEVAGAQERHHVEALQKDLNTVSAVSEPRFDVGAALRSPAAFVRTATALEDATVAAYNGQATNLTPERLLQVCSIVSVEARHAAWIRDIGGLPPAEGATDAPLRADQVRDILRREGLLA
jgi:hypothetical protein